MKEAYYFSHDSNAKDDPKCILLIEQLGLEGYGIFWILVELLRDQPEHKYPLSLIPAIARRFNSTTEKVNVVVKKYDLFVIENDEFFYSESLNERMQIAEEKRIKKSNAGQLGNAVRWGNQRLIAEVSQCDANPIAIKESKVKEKKVKERLYTEEIANRLWETYPLKKGKSDAYKHIEKLINKGVTEEQLLNSINNYKSQIKDPQFTYHGSTFFYSKWEDYINENETRQKPPKAIW